MNFDDFRTSGVVASSDLQSVVAETKSELVSDNFDPDFDDFQDAKVWQTSDSDKGKDAAWPDDSSFQASTFPVDQSSMKSGTLNDGAWAAFETGSVDSRVQLGSCRNRSSKGSIKYILIIILENIISFMNILISFMNMLISFMNIFISFMNILISFMNILISFMNILISFRNILISCFMNIL